MTPMDVKFRLFNIILLGYILYFLYNLYKYSFVHSLWNTLLMWATIVVATPFISFGIISSSPIKLYLHIPMYVGQIAASILSLFLIFNYTSYAPSIISKIIDKKMYSIFVISIISSIMLSMIVDNIIDYYTRSTKINPWTMSALIISSSILIYLYKVKIMIAEN